MNIEQLNEIFKEVDENKKKIVQSMFDDFIHEHELLEKLKPQIKAVEQPKNQREAEKLKYFTKIYSDTSQRHDSKIKIMLSTLSKFEGDEENPIAAWIREKSEK
jgi:hypothetical protein